MSTDKWITLCAVTIKFTEVWAIGGNAALDAEVKIPIVHDPRYKNDDDLKPILPGASIAGSLRAAAMTQLQKEKTERLFGHVTRSVEADGKTKTTAAEASEVQILGAELLDRTQGMVFEHTRTRVDVKTGAADTGSLRNEHVVNPARYRIAIQINAGPEDPTMKEWLQVVEKWVPQLGRGRTYGFGHGEVTEIEWVSANLGTYKGLEWWLQDRTDFFTDEHAEIVPVSGALETGKATPQQGKDAAKYRITFQVREPIHVGKPPKDPKSTIPVYRLSGVPSIPGSSWKGVLRHRVETIVNVVAGEELSEKITAELFGSEEKGRGMLWFRNSTFTAADGKSEATCGKREHVAIDRFSGGAKDTAKFTWECVLPGNEVTLEIHAPRMVQGSELDNLVQHALRDVHDGIIGIGAGISRGYGRLEAKTSEQITARPIDVEALEKECLGERLEVVQSERDLP